MKEDIEKVQALLREALNTINEMMCVFDARLGQCEPEWLRRLELDVETAIYSADEAHSKVYLPRE